MIRAYYAMLLFAIALLISNTMQQTQLINELHIACAIGVSMPLPAAIATACAQDVPNGLSAIAAIAANVGPVGVPFYAYAMIAVAFVAPVVIRRTRVALLGVAITGVALLVGIAPAFDTQNRLSNFAGPSHAVAGSNVAPSAAAP